MATPVGLFPGLSIVLLAGIAVNAVQANSLGGRITNPFSAEDQGIENPEVLYVDPAGPAGLSPSTTTIAIQPGQTFYFAAQTEPVSVNAATPGHRFTCVVFQSPTQFPPTSTAGAFPPSGPTGLTTVVPSYVYQQYSDDSDIQAFFDAYNTYTQDYIDTFASLNLPVYTAPNITGAFLDWVLTGLYGLPRPALGSGQSSIVGLFNTYELNTIEFDKSQRVGPTDIVATSDDFYKRIATWHLYKGDGKVFTIRWLKRRVMRFIIGVDGSAPNIDQTYQISVQFGANYEASIKFIDSITTVLNGALFGTFEMNVMRLDELNTQTEQLTPLPNREIFKEAVDSGALELPFQWTWTVTI